MGVQKLSRTTWGGLWGKAVHWSMQWAQAAVWENPPNNRWSFSPMGEHSNMSASCGRWVPAALPSAPAAWGCTDMLGQNRCAQCLMTCSANANGRPCVLRILSLAHGWEYRAGSALLVLLPDLRSFILPMDYELILLNIRVDALSYFSVSVGR